MIDIFRFEQFRLRRHFINGHFAIVEYLDNRFQGRLICRTSGFRRLLEVIYRLLDGSLAVCVRLIIYWSDLLYYHCKQLPACLTAVDSLYRRTHERYRARSPTRKPVPIWARSFKVKKNRTQMLRRGFEAELKKVKRNRKAAVTKLRHSIETLCVKKDDIDIEFVEKQVENL